MTTKRRWFSDLALVVLISVVASFMGCVKKEEFSPKPYLEDFEALKVHISKSYANLEYLLKYYEIDPYQLSTKTIQSIQRAKTKEEAIESIQDFVKTFKDGHFNLREQKVESSSESHSEKVVLSKKTSAKLACERLGFSWNENLDFRFPIEGVAISEKGHGEFPFLIVQKDSKKIGILRVADFRETSYPEICLKAWDKFKVGLTGSCDDACADNFQYEFMRKELAEKFYESMDKVRSKKVDVLVLDLTNNGGGSDWVTDVTALLTTKPVICGRSGFVKHPHHAENFKKLLEELQNAPRKDEDQIAAMKENLKIASESCDRTSIWKVRNFKLGCSLVGYSKNQRCAYQSLKYPGKKKYDGKLYLLVNGGTASAAEDIVARHLDSGTATVIGSRTYGAGCGYMNGGIKFRLPNTGLEVRVPDCIRERADGTNEVVGIEPDIKIDMSRLKETSFLSNLVDKLVANSKEI